MAPRGSIERLPSQIRERLESALVARSFGDYRQITDELNAWLEADGLDISVSKSAVHRFGQTVADRISALKQTTEIARTLAREVGDDDGALNEALIRLTQEKLFNAVLDLEINPDEIDTSKLGKMIRDLGAASVEQGKYRAAVRERARLEAQAVKDIVRKGGLSDEMAAEVEGRILGIVR